MTPPSYQTDNTVVGRNNVKVDDNVNTGVIYHRSLGGRIMILLVGAVAMTATAGVAIKNNNRTVVDSLSTATATEKASSRYSATTTAAELVHNSGTVTPIIESDLNPSCKPNMLADFRNNKFFSMKEGQLSGTWYFSPPGSDGYPIPKDEQLSGHYTCEEFCESCVCGNLPDQQACSSDGVWNCKICEKTYAFRMEGSNNKYSENGDYGLYEETFYHGDQFFGTSTYKQYWKLNNNGDGTRQDDPVVNIIAEDYGPGTKLVWAMTAPKLGIQLYLQKPVNNKNRDKPTLSDVWTKAYNHGQTSIPHTVY